MNWITDHIAIGNYLDAQDAALRRREGIRSMLCLNGQLRGAHPETLDLEALENYDLKDGPGNSPEIFKRCVDAVGLLSRRHPKLLVHCYAGRSRSVVVVAAHFMRANGWGREEALAFVTAKREAALTPGIEQLLNSPFLYSPRT